MNTKTLSTRQNLRRSMRFLHRFSDSLLHTSLLVAIVLLAGLALYHTISSSTGIVWVLEPVLVQGQAKR